MTARLFFSAKAETISPAFAVCSFTNSTTTYEKRGKEHGHDLDDWLSAEAELA
jgi:hypothetical protein